MAGRRTSCRRSWHGSQRICRILVGPSTGFWPKAENNSSYKGLYYKHISPALGATKLRDLRRIHVKTLLIAKSAEIFRVRRRERDGSGEIVDVFVERKFSKNSLRLIRVTLSTLLAEALDDELIRSNPAAMPPRRRGRKGTANLTAIEKLKAIRPFSENELQKILKSTAGDYQYAALFLLLARTGMRPGEAFALRWSDCDFVGRKVLVERGCHLAKSGALRRARFELSTCLKNSAPV